MPLDVRLASNITMGQGMFGNYNVYIENSEVLILFTGYNLSICMKFTHQYKTYTRWLDAKKRPYYICWATGEYRN